MTVSSKYDDAAAIVQVIGCIARHPSYLNREGEYFFCEDDFQNQFHKVIFGAIYNLHKMGTNDFSPKVIEDYLDKRPESLSLYKKFNGGHWLIDVMNQCDITNFDYYYNRMKKMTLLRSYDDLGLDVSWIYDPDNILDLAKKQKQENNLDKMSLNEIADLIDERIQSIRLTYIDNATDEAVSIGDGILDFLEELKESPELGSPMYGSYINTITRGCRTGKFYLRSAATGVGKSRTMIADACNLACDEYYNTQTKKWEKKGICEPVVFISTELELSEVRTMALAFLSGVNEEHILTNNYCAFDDEWDRVKYAAQVLQNAPLFIETIPDFSLRDIENIIKRNIRVNKCHYVFK